MAQSEKVRRLREMMSVAKKLRDSAAISSDSVYTELFLRTAAALEDHATHLAFGDPAEASGLQADLTITPPVNLIC